MKQYIKNISILFSVFYMASCSKNFLDRPLENTYNSSGIKYSNTTAMYTPVVGIYSSAANGAPGFTHWVDFAIRGIRGDDFEKGSSASDQSQLTDVKNFHNGYASVQTFWALNNSWIDYYGLAVNCNSAMADLDSFAHYISASDATNLALNKQYKSEVRFFRAYAHLLVSRIFGDVPILVNNDSITSIHKSSYADVRKFIISEMDTCVNFLEDNKPNAASHIGAVTKYTALLLKAKAAADLGGNDNGNAYWDTVLNCTNRIIESNKFSLYSDYYQLFKKPGKLSDESLYEIQFSDYGTSTGDAISPGNFWDFQGPAGDQHGSPIAGWGFMPPTQNIADFLSGRNDSVRYKTTILLCGINGAASTYSLTPSGDTVYGNANGTKYFNGKAYLPKSQMTGGRTNYGSNNNIRVLRYADVLLLNAEAKVRKGQNGDAPLNLVRSRVKLNSINGATLQNVLDERRAEFACEWWGERYNDLVRTSQASTVLASNGYTSENTYLPIPQTQKDLNSSLAK